MTPNVTAPVIDGLQYANWSPKIFDEMRQGGVDAVHVTITYHENFRETVANIQAWNRLFERHPDRIFQGFTAADIEEAQRTGRTAIFFGSQNPSCIEGDIGLIEILHRLGLRFMQLTYNNQSLLATGSYEAEDAGLTRMGHEVVQEMNRVGLVVDMSHSAERSTMEAIELSSRPITVSHANPADWHPALRNKSETVIKALAESGGMFGFSLYPHHLKDGSHCTLASFCEMIARCVDRHGIECFGIGSDLCQDQPDSVVEWMRVGTWTKQIDFGEGSANQPGFPDMPDWFSSNLHLRTIARGLAATGFSQAEVDSLMGGNWQRFFERSFGPTNATPRKAMP